MIVRAAGVEDARRIAEVHVSAWRAGYRGLLSDPLLDGLRPDQRLERWTGTLRTTAWPARGTLLAEEDGEVLGFLDLAPSRDADRGPADVGEIVSLNVRSTAWGRGVGTNLMGEAVRTLVAAGCAAATLWVLEGNTRAIRFYGRAGWDPDGAVRHDEVGGTAIRDLRYRRALP